MYTVVVTGGIGSGKSAVCDYLSDRGAHMISLDRIGHAVLEHEDVREQLVDAFGRGILDEDGRIDRAALAQVAFKDEVATETLNSITHPAILEQALKNITMLETPCVPVSDAPLTVIELPIVPTGTDDLGSILGLADEVIAVTANRETREERLFARGLTPDDIVARMAAQPGDEAYAAVANVVIDNSGTLEELHEELDRWWQEHEAACWGSKACENGDSGE